MLLFRESLAELMSEKKLTTISLGEAIGVSATTVHCWLTGKTKLFLSNALKLTDYFECSLEFLLGRTAIRLSYTPKVCPPFYDRLKEIMTLQGKSSYRIVKDTSFSFGHFSKWRNGGDPYIETLLNLTAYFDCSLDYLVGRDI